jgi:RNA polymerase sigma factor (sigma-70 family)
VDPPADLAEFCKLQYPRLVGTLSLYCGDAQLAEDLAQEALTRACSRWAQVSRMASPGAWVHRVGINAANSSLRRRNLARRVQARLESSADAVVEPPDVAGDIALRRAVAALPAGQRSALVLRYFSDMTVVEAAEALGCTPQAVRNRTNRALENLRQLDGQDLTHRHAEADECPTT